MSPTRVFGVARHHLIELRRRPLALSLLLLMPILFYLAGRDHPNETFAPTFATIGTAWAVSIITLFSGLAVEAVSPRLTLAGYRSVELVVGRLLAIVSVGMVVAAGLWLVTMQFSPIDDGFSLALSFLAALCTGVLLGLAVGGLIAKEMEATLVLILVSGLQLPIRHESLAARLLPMYATERLSARSVSYPVMDGVIAGVGVTSLVVLFAIAVLATTRRFGK